MSKVIIFYINFDIYIYIYIYIYKLYNFKKLINFHETFRIVSKHIIKFKLLFTTLNKLLEILIWIV